MPKGYVVGYIPIITSQFLPQMEATLHLYQRSLVCFEAHF